MLNGMAEYSWASTAGRVAVALAVTVGFALLARFLHGVNRSGMIAGGVACFLLFAGVGPPAFAVLAALFLLTWISTRFGYRRKQDLGIAERRDGRNAWQVLANLAVPALGSVTFAATGNRAWLFAIAATLAEAAVDTVASEIGQTGRPAAVLITTWKPVPAGTDGGISVSGTAAGAAAGLMIAGVAAWGGIVAWPLVWIPVSVGFVGMLADSVLGATVQRRGGMSNEAVNFFSTVIAAALGYSLALRAMA